MDEPWDTFSAFDDSDCDDADLFFDFPDDNSDSDASDLEPDRFMPVPPPIDRVHYQPRTALTQRYAEARRRDLDEGEIGQKVIAVVKYLRDVKNISLELFLDAVFWGNPACV